MEGKKIMFRFFQELEEKKELTLFIKNLFDYQELYDYNYIFRLGEQENKVIIDIYDNISIHRFNRYIFNFTKGEYDINVTEDNNVFLTTINIPNVLDSNNKLLMFAYLFKTDNMITYANRFLDKKHVLILENILKEKDFI